MSVKNFLLTSIEQMCLCDKMHPKKVGMLEFRHFHGSKNVQKKKISFYWGGIFHLFERQKQTFFSPNTTQTVKILFGFTIISPTQIYKDLSTSTSMPSLRSTAKPPAKCSDVVEKILFLLYKLHKTSLYGRGHGQLLS